MAIFWSIMSVVWGLIGLCYYDKTNMLICFCIGAVFAVGAGILKKMEDV